MCVVSNVGDFGSEFIRPWIRPRVDPYEPYEPYTPWSQEALDAFIKALEAAREYDKATGQPNCENPDKTKVVEEIKKRADENGPAKDDVQVAFAKELVGLRALIDSQCSVPLILAAMESIVARYRPLRAAP